MSAHVFAAVLIISAALAIFWLGWHAHGLRTDREPFRQAKHARQDDAPRPTALLQPPRPEVPPPPWHFAGESEQGWAAESAEYELLTQTAEQPEEQPPPDEIPGRLTLPFPEVAPGVDTPSDYMQSMTERVNAMIAAYEGDTNEFIHSMPRVVTSQ